MVLAGYISKYNHLRVILTKSVQSLADQVLPKLVLKDQKIFVTSSSSQDEAELWLDIQECVNAECTPLRSSKFSTINFDTLN